MNEYLERLPLERIEIGTNVVIGRLETKGESEGKFWGGETYTIHTIQQIQQNTVHLTALLPILHIYTEPLETVFSSITETREKCKTLVDSVVVDQGKKVKNPC